MPSNLGATQCRRTGELGGLSTVFELWRLTCALFLADNTSAALSAPRQVHAQLQVGGKITGIVNFSWGNDGHKTIKHNKAVLFLSNPEFRFVFDVTLYCSDALLHFRALRFFWKFPKYLHLWSWKPERSEVAMEAPNLCGGDVCTGNFYQTVPVPFWCHLKICVNKMRPSAGKQYLNHCKHSWESNEASACSCSPCSPLDVHVCTLCVCVCVGV